MTRVHRQSAMAGCLLAASVLAGCASGPAERGRSQAAAPDNAGAGGPVTDPPSTTPTADQARRQVEADDGAIPAETLEYTPRQWSAPSRDVWAAVREGFAMDPETDRRAVRIWTQFYATHTGHLDASLERARPFIWHVMQQIDERDLPTELALLPIVESGYNPSAKSYAGASGLWQFMPLTADHMSLARDWWYDGRNDPIASTDAALDYLEELHRRYNGNWRLALAAYNAGPGRVDNALERARAEGGSTSYWSLELPEETRNYVPQLLALRQILEAPERYGVDWPSLDNRPRTRVVQLPAQTDLQKAAAMLDMPEKKLRKLNPGMRRWASDPSGHGGLLVPAAKAPAFRKALADIDPDKLVNKQRHIVRRGDSLGRLAQAYGVSVARLRQANNLTSNTIRVGQRLTVPRPGGPVRQAASQPSQTYVVQSGDTLSEIAERYSVSLASLRRANSGASRTLRPGRSLDIPGSAKPATPTTHVVSRGETLWSIARANDISVAALRQWNRIKPGETLSPGTSIALDGPSSLPDFYEVEPGDSLWSIADRFSMRVTTLRSLNDMSTNSTIQPGERLRLQPPVSS